MRDPQAKTVFERTYRDYLDQMRNVDMARIAVLSGVPFTDGTLGIPLFGRPYSVSLDGITGPEGESVPFPEKVALCKYVLLFPDPIPNGTDWITYKDFKDAAPFVGWYQSHIERSLASHIAGRRDALEAAVRRLDGQPPDIPLPYDIAAQFTALPHLPIMLLFNDTDDEFPAQASILFQRRASHFLDMECLAGISILFVNRLMVSMEKYV